MTREYVVVGYQVVHGISGKPNEVLFTNPEAAWVMTGDLRPDKKIIVTADVHRDLKRFGFDEGLGFVGLS